MPPPRAPPTEAPPTWLVVVIDDCHGGLQLPHSHILCCPEAETLALGGDLETRGIRRGIAVWGDMGKKGAR